jgi:hypothetical protein
VDREPDLGPHWCAHERPRSDRRLAGFGERLDGLRRAIWTVDVPERALCFERHREHAAAKLTSPRGISVCSNERERRPAP